MGAEERRPSLHLLKLPEVSTRQTWKVSGGQEGKRKDPQWKKNREEGHGLRNTSWRTPPYATSVPEVSKKKGSCERPDEPRERGIKERHEGKGEGKASKPDREPPK